MLLELCGLVSVAILWGATNPLIKTGTTDIVRVKSDSKVKQFLLELKYLITNYKYIIPMGLNQLGSVVYFFVLQRVDISLAVPVTNSLTFVFTALMGWFLNERMPNKDVLLGVCLIIMGTSFLCYDKLAQEISGK